MCGIAGIIKNRHWRLDGDLPKRMLDSMHHRGPDGRGLLSVNPGGEIEIGEAVDGFNANVLLLHTRLAIIDLTELGHQPLSSADGNFHLTFNGEIYNYVELRSELQALGVHFRSQTDTEVLLAAWIQWGKQCIDRLVGMFAFAIVDIRQRKTFLVRDPFGIKPLFYATVPGKGLVFASEIKTIRAIPSLGRKANRRAVQRFLADGRDIHNRETFFEDIARLPPAHIAEVANDQLDKPVVLERYWELTPKLNRSITYEDAVIEFRSRFLDNIKLHLRSDVPVGTALSGGIDSSSIVACVRQIGGTAQEIHSFSFVAPGSPLNEEKWIDIVTQASNTVSHKVVVERNELLRDLDRVLIAQDEPFLTSSICAQYRVFDLAHKAGIKVLLDGQGADEMLAGYPTYQRAFARTLLSQCRIGAAIRFCQSVRPSLLSASSLFLRGVAQTVMPARVLHGLQQGMRQHPTKSWLDSTVWGEVSSDDPSRGLMGLRDTLVHSLHRTLPGLLRYEDRNSMNFSIESRVPFLTRGLAEFALSLPEDFLLDSQGTSKRIVRDAMRGIAEDRVLDRTDKIGFRTPEKQWLEELKPDLDGVLSSEVARSLPFFINPIDSDDTGADTWKCACLIRWFEINNVEW